MRFVAIFEDSPEMDAVRTAREPAHLSYLEAHRSEILIAGGLREEHGGPFVGGLWIFEVDSKQRAMELIEGDPYFVSHLRHYRLLTWGKALSEHQITL
jgi:uncharacterized protein